MREEPLTAEESLVLLRENASRLAAATEGVPAERLHAIPAPEEWSPNEVLAHMRACCDVWGANIERILAADHPTFAGRSPRAWIKRTDYHDWPFEKALRTFAAQRDQLLRTLEGLAPGDWERTAFVTSYGSQGIERTVRSYASKLAKHERSHVKQIARDLGPPGLA